MLGNPILDRMIILFNLIATLGSLGVFYYMEKIYKRPMPNDQLEFQLLKDSIQKQSLVTPFPLKKMIINLYSPNTRLRFLEVEMHLLPYLDLHTPLLESNQHFIYDSIIQIVSKMGPQEINTVAGKILLEDRLKKNLNKLLQKKVIKKIYFTIFVVQ